jgi:hypothetical protein
LIARSQEWWEDSEMWRLLFVVVEDGIGGPESECREQEV